MPSSSSCSKEGDPTEAGEPAKGGVPLRTMSLILSVTEA
jgi:hypothetical protein